MSTIFTKDPDAVLDYKVDWSDWLGDDTISTSTFTVPAGITKDSQTNSTTYATVWLSGGTAGSSYSVVNSITTSSGRTDNRTMIIQVRER